MDPIKNIAEFFLLSMGLGMGLFPIVVASKATGEGFPKLIHGISLGSLAIALIVYLSRVSGGERDPLLLLFFALVSVFLVMNYFRPEWEKDGWGKILYLGKNASYLGLSFLFMGKNPLQFSFFLVTALLVGSIVFGMLLGHWYLVVPKLSEKPMLKVMQFTWVGLFLKVLFAVGALAGGAVLLEGEGLLSFKSMVFFMRIFWGHVAVLILGIFAWKLVKIRSLQSATGMLYVMVFFVFIGEMISAYLFYYYGLLV